MTSRRQFLTGSGIAAGLALAPSWARADFVGPRPISETFVFPEWTAAMAQLDGVDRVFWRAFSANADLSAPDSALLSAPAPGVEPFAPAQARELAAIGNDRLAACVNASKGMLSGLAMVAAMDRDASKEAERALVGLRLHGLVLGANRGLRLDHRSLWPVYEIASALGAPIYLPARYAAAAGAAPYVEIGLVGEIYGPSAESAAHATQLIFGGVLDAFPTLQVVLGRLGEGAPYWLNHLQETHAGLVEAGLAAPRRSIGDYFGRNIKVSSEGMSPQRALYCRELLGQRAVFG